MIRPGHHYVTCRSRILQSLARFTDNVGAEDSEEEHDGLPF